MAGITYILWIHLVLIFNNNPHDVTCQEPTETPTYVYFDANSDSRDFGGFLPPTPYLPNNGEYVYDGDYESLYPFPDDIPCEQRKRCQRRHQNYNLDLKDQNCFCDERCVVYSDCCVDYGGPKSPPIALEKSAIACRVVREIDPNNAILLVDSCPRDMSDDYLRDQCEIFYPENGFLNLPVSGRSSGILYKNVYCALCSGENVVDFWTAEYHCRRPPRSVSGSSGMDAKAALDETLDSSTGCKRIYKHSTHSVRYCKPDVINRCHRDWRDKKVKRRCKSETDTSYVYYAQNRIFKNMYCAICNNVNESQTTCTDDVTAELKLPVMQGDFPLGTPFSVLLDLNKGSASVAVKNMVDGTGRYEKTEIVVNLRQCPENHVYDPFSRMCRLVGCSSGQTFNSGLCIPNSDDNLETTPNARPKSPKNRNSSAVNSGQFIFQTTGTSNPLPTQRSKSDTSGRGLLTCAVISYTYSEYVTLPDGSVQIISNGRIYTHDQYELGSFNEVYVCSPFANRSQNNTFNETQVIIMFQFNRLQSLLSVICLLVSLVSLVTVFIVYMILPPLRTIQGKCLMSLVAALFTAHLLFLVGTQQTRMELVCHVIGAVLHYCFLAALFWVNVLALDICTTFTSKKAARNEDENTCRFACYSFYAWLTPALIVGGSVALDFLSYVPERYKPHYATDLCWISQKDALFYLFALPIAIILTVNFILFVITVIGICAASRTAKMPQHKRKQVGTFVLYVKLGLIMGLSWVFAFIATLTDHDGLWYVFIALNALQGLFICTAFVCTGRVLEMIANLGKPAERRKAAAAGGYHACANGSVNGTVTRHTGLYDPTVRLELESHETSI